MQHRDKQLAWEKFTYKPEIRKSHERLGKKYQSG